MTRQFQLNSEEDMEAREYLDDENQVKHIQAISSHRTIWRASLTHQPFLKFAYLELAEPAVNMTTLSLISLSNYYLYTITS